MRSRLGVLLLDRRQPIFPQLRSQPNQGRPESLVHERDLPVDEPKAQDIGRIVDGPKREEDLGAFRVTPPASADRLAGNSFGQVRHRSFAGRQSDAVPRDEIHRIEASGHRLLAYVNSEEVPASLVNQSAVVAHGRPQQDWKGVRAGCRGWLITRDCRDAVANGNPGADLMTRAPRPPATRGAFACRSPLYRYALGDPTDRTDPTGMYSPQDKNFCMEQPYGCPGEVNCGPVKCHVSHCGTGSCAICGKDNPLGNLVVKAWCQYDCDNGGAATGWYVLTKAFFAGPFCINPNQNEFCSEGHP